MTEAAHLRATRAGYDAVAEEYAVRSRTELDGSPLDRAVLGAFAELVGRDHPDAEVLEVGSGPGTVAAYLHRLGLTVRGIDLSPASVALARREHPGVAFDVGEMGALGVPDARLAGLVAWYSIIHVPAADLAATFAEFHRVLRPGGHLLLGFQVGDEVHHLDEAFGRPVSLDFHRLRPDAVEALLAAAGFGITARQVRAPEAASEAQKIPQCALLARKG